MSGIRSQATPARDSGLTDALRDVVGDNYDHGRNPNLTGQLWHEDGIRDSIDWAGAARDLERDGWSKPRTVTSADELKALPTCSLIRGLEREGQRSGDVFEKVGLDHWLCLDPGDRFDGEETTPSHAIVLIYKAGIRVLFTPGDVG